MIRPQSNLHRHTISLDGIWQCRPDPNDVGLDRGWQDGLTDTLPIAVPGSWNEQLAEIGLLNYTGTLWYQRDIWLPAFADGCDISLYFGSVDYNAQVFVDGKLVGTSDCLMLPFEVPIGGVAKPGQFVRLVIKVDAQLPEHGPMQRVTRDDYVAEKRDRDEYWPAVRFDFFPFGGLNRSVYLCVLPKRRIMKAQVDTGWDETFGTLSVCIESTEGSLACYLDGAPVGEAFTPGQPFSLDLPDVEPWSPDHPKLYRLEIVLSDAQGRALGSGLIN